MFKLCYHCGVEITPKIKYFMYALERPYANLFFHRTCLDGIQNVEEYLYLNPDRILIYFNNPRSVQNKSNVV